MSDVAAACNISERQCEHLEWYDDDAFMSVSIATICSMAELLGSRPDVFLAPPHTKPIRVVTMESLVDGIVSEMRSNSESVEAIGKRVGWDLASAIEDPGAAWRDWNLDCLQDVSRTVGVDWLDVVAAWPGHRPSSR